MNTLFVNTLGEFEYKKEYQGALKKILLQKLKEKASVAIEETKSLKKKISEKQGLFEKVEEKSVLGDITKEQFVGYTEKFQQELKLLSENMKLIEKNGLNFEITVDKCLKLAEKLSNTWVSASFENKLKLQKLITAKRMVYNKKDVEFGI